jgi:acyl-CoA thioester hydrolase
MDDAPRRSAVSVRIPVAWGEMDAFQHVNNVVYARWVETARIAYFERVGFMELMRDAGTGPILARLVVDYRRPVTYPDTVRVDVATSRVGKTSFTMGFRVWSEDQRAEVASGEQVVVVFDYRAGRPTEVTEKLRSAITAVEAPAG